MKKTKIIREIIGTRIEPYGFTYLKTDGPSRIFVREVTGIKRYYDPDNQVVKQYINIQESQFYKGLVVRLSTDAVGGGGETDLEQIKMYSKTGWLEYVDEVSYKENLNLLADLIIEYGFTYLDEHSIEKETIQTKAMQEKLAQHLDQLDQEFINEYHIKTVPEQIEDIDEWIRLIKQLIADNAERPYEEVKDLLIKIAAFIAKRDCELLQKHCKVTEQGILVVISGPILINYMDYTYQPLQLAVFMWRLRYEDPDMTQNFISTIINDMKQALLLQKE